MPWLEMQLFCVIRHCAEFVEFEEAATEMTLLLLTSVNTNRNLDSQHHV